MLDMNNYDNSIKYYGHFIDKDLIYLIMELCDFSLDELTKKKNLILKK